MATDLRTGIRMDPSTSTKPTGKRSPLTPNWRASSCSPSSPTRARIFELRGRGAPPVRRVLDIGSGPGVGTCELARLFPDAKVEPMRFLPDDLDVGQPGLADRLSRAEADWFAAMRAGLSGSVPSADLASMLSSAGFDGVGPRLALERIDRRCRMLHGTSQPGTFIAPGSSSVRYSMTMIFARSTC